MKSFEAPTTEKREFKPFYQDEEEEIKDIVAPLIEKDDLKKFEKRKTTEKAGLRPQNEFKNFLLQQNNDAADDLDDEDNANAIFEDIFDSTITKPRSNTQHPNKEQSPVQNTNIGERESKVLLSDPRAFDSDEDDKLDITSYHSRHSDGRRTAMKFSRAHTKPEETNSDKVRILRELKERQEAELNTSEDFIEDKSFDFDDDILEIEPEAKANDQFNDFPAEETQDSKIDQFFKDVKEQNLADLHDLHRSVEIIEDCVDALKIVDSNEKKYLDFAHNK